MIALLCLLLPLGIHALALTASQSDMGLYTMISNGPDANLYFTGKFKQSIQIHLIVAQPTCECIGKTDIQKIYQIDYMTQKEYLISFGSYVNSDQFFDRRKCPLDMVDIQARSDLKFNPLGAYTEPAARQWSWDINYNTYERIEGVTLAMGMRDFYEHSYVKKNYATMRKYDKDGGILFMQGNTMLRPCQLFPWPTPWIFNPREDSYHFQYTLPYTSDAVYTIPAYFPAEDVALFNSIFDQMKADGIVTSAHLHNMGLNSGAVYMMHSFSFSVLFVHHRSADEFLALLEPFAYTRLSPFVYVPFIYQLMFKPGDWLHFRQSTRNDTFQHGMSLLHTCDGTTVEETMANINEEAASDLFSYMVVACGWYVDIFFIMETARNFFQKNFFTAAFFVLLAINIVYFCYAEHKRLWSMLVDCAYRCRGIRRRRNHTRATSNNVDDHLAFVQLDALQISDDGDDHLI